MFVNPRLLEIFKFEITFFTLIVIISWLLKLKSSHIGLDYLTFE